MPDTYHIELEEGAVPVVHAPRKVPMPQRAKVFNELKRMEKLGVIVRQEEPTEWVWVNSLVSSTEAYWCSETVHLSEGTKSCHKETSLLHEDY